MLYWCPIKLFLRNKNIECTPTNLMIWETPTIITS